MQRIRVLLYTDFHNPSNPRYNMTLEPADPFQAPFGLSLMKDLILTFKDMAADIEIDLINRNIPYHGAQKITSHLLRCYDELWIFGQYKVNMHKYGIKEGGPENELTREEIEALRVWMDTGGGVLITGDHSAENPLGGEPELYNLGRALGQCIPRAGKMREWEGLPGADDTNSFNTQSPGKAVFRSLALQEDAEPQHIMLQPDKTQGDQESEQPHKLFSGGPNNRILVFPDHTHEGKLRIPKLYGDEWPKGSIAPFIVAKGLDKRFCPPRIYDLVSVYDGDPAGVGRIVADSSWHHYLNINLRGLRFDRRDPAAPLSQIGQYYANLVHWLAPRDIRSKLASARLYWIATHPQVLEVADSSPYALGETVKYVMRKECRPSELQELLRSSIPMGLAESAELFFFVPEELRLGILMKVYHENIQMLGTEAEEKLTEENKRIALVSNAFKRALEAYLTETDIRIKRVDRALGLLLLDSERAESLGTRERGYKETDEEETET